MEDDISWTTAATNAFAGGFDAGQAYNDAQQGNWAGAGENALGAAGHFSAAFGEASVGDE